MVVTDRFHCITKPVILLKTIIGRRHPIWPNTNCITQSEAFLDRFSFVILIRWKIYSALTQVVVMQALWNFAQKLCKILERYGILQWSYTKTNFLSNLNYDEMIVREMDTGFQMRCSLKSSLSYQCFRIPQTAIFKWVRQDPGGPMLAPWALLSGTYSLHMWCYSTWPTRSLEISWHFACSYHSPNGNTPGSTKTNAVVWNVSCSL